MTTLEEARAQLRTLATDGTRCPCCEQHVKIWKRKMNRMVAASLLWLGKQHAAGRTWVRVADAPRKLDMRGEFTKARYWGLIVRAPNDHGQKRTSGLWRLTDGGHEFVFRGGTNPDAVFVFNNKVLRFSEKSITIDEALGVDFSYADLVRSA